METKSEKQGQSLIDVGEAKSLKQKALTSLHPLPPGVNPDLAEERSRPCSFSQTELTELIDGGRQKTEERKRLEQIFLDGLVSFKLQRNVFVAKNFYPSTTDGLKCNKYRQLNSLKLFSGHVSKSR